MFSISGPQCVRNCINNNNFQLATFGTSKRWRGCMFIELCPCFLDSEIMITKINLLWYSVVDDKCKTFVDRFCWTEVFYFFRKAKKSKAGIDKSADPVKTIACPHKVRYKFGTYIVTWWNMFSIQWNLDKNIIP